MVAGLLDALDLLRVALEAGRQPTEGDLQRLREHSALWAPATREAALTSQRDDDRTADKGAVNCVQSETSPRPCRPLHLRPQDPQCQYSTLSCVKLSLTDGSLPASAQRLQTGGVRGICTAIVISDMVEPDGRGDVERLLRRFMVIAAGADRTETVNGVLPLKAADRLQLSVGRQGRASRGVVNRWAAGDETRSRRSRARIIGAKAFQRVQNPLFGPSVWRKSISSCALGSRPRLGRFHKWPHASQPKYTAASVLERTVGSAPPHDGH